MSTIKEKIKSCLQVKNLVWLIFIVLFTIPFFWFQPGEADFGGDSSRLYFYDPLSYLQTIGMLGANRAVASIGVSDFAIMPFLVLLLVIKTILFNNYSLLLSIFNGSLLAGAFLGVYLIIRELIDKKDNIYSYLASIMGGLFHIFSGILVYNWQKYLTSFHSIAVYPLVVWLFIKYLKTAKKIYLLYLLLLSLIFSVNFSFAVSPVFFSFFPTVLLFLFIYSLIEKKGKLFFKGFFLVLLFFILLQAFHLLPLVMNTLDPANSINKMVFTSAGKIDRGLAYFEGNAPVVKLIYNLLAYPQYSLYQTVGAPPGIIKMIYDYGIKYIGFLFIFPAILVLALAIKKEKKDNLIFISLFAVFLVILFFMTANIFGHFGPDFYASLFNLPGFAMFRSFYGAFANILVFLYALLFGLSLFYVLEKLSHRRVIAGLLLAVLFLALGHNGWPAISGQVSNTVIHVSNDIKLSNKLKPALEETIAYLRTTSLDTALLTLPLLNYNYQIIEGQYGGAYLGIPIFPMLTGRTTYSGLGAFDYPESEVFSQNFVLAALKENDHRSLNRLFSLLNIGLVFNNSDAQIYQDFPGFPYSAELKKIFPTTADFAALIKNLNYQTILVAENYSLSYQLEYFLPYFYTPRAIIQTSSAEEFKKILKNEVDYDLRTVFYTRQLAVNSLLDKLPSEILEPPQIEFKKINAVKYRLRLHQIHGSFPLVMSEVWHRDWQLTPLLPGKNICSSAPVGQNQLLGAAAAEIKEKCSQGLITATGSNFISSDIQGTIQNENLPAGGIFEGYGLKKISPEYHLPANEYANSWWLDLDYLKANFPEKLQKNQDGSFDLELLVDFSRKKYFYWGEAISGLTLLFLIVCLIFIYIRNKH